MHTWPHPGLSTGNLRPSKVSASPRNVQLPTALVAAPVRRSAHWGIRHTLVPAVLVLGGLVASLLTALPAAHAGVSASRPVAGVVLDLTRGATATQSSVWQSADANRAVDGNTDGQFWVGSVTHTNIDATPWWQVDLGRVALLSKVTLWNRTDCCTDRWNGAIVLVSNTDPTGRTLPDLQADPTVAKRPIGSPTTASVTLDLTGVAGRYVRVELPSTGILSLAEVRVLGSAAATQSSTYQGASADRALDGDTDGTFVAGSLTHTNYETNPWWQVDLGAVTTLTTVTLWGRTDSCCTGWWNGALVLVSTTDPTGRSLADLQADPAVAQRSIGSPTTSSVTVDLVGVTGRYVRVQLPTTGNLALAEVRVRASGSVTQSSTYLGASADLALDGNTDGNFFGGSVTHTNNEATPWWQADLGAITSLDKITLWGRTDCCADRWNDAVVMVSDTDPAGRGLADLQADPTVFKQSIGRPGGSSVTLHLAGVEGRYVRVQLPGVGALSLAEIQITGSGLAVGRPAAQSSTYAHGPGAAAAVDGSTDGTFSNGSVTHTNIDTNPWWQVDLGAVTTLDKVTVWNRTDCCQDRLNGALVLVSATDPTGRTLADLQADPTVAKRSIGTPTTTSVAVDLSGVHGRYVRVQLPSSGILSLAEVQVSGLLATTQAPVSADCAAKRSSTGSDVVLLMGQSNMSGVGRQYDSAVDGPNNPRVLQWSRAGTTITASETLQQADWTQGATLVGPGTAFGRAYLTTLPPQRTVLLVPTAYGGTNLVNGPWSPGGNLFEDAVARLKAALAADPGNCVAAVLWDQGEGDTLQGVDPATYRTTLASMIATLRTREPRAAATPFILAEFAPSWTAQVRSYTPVDAILDAIHAIPSQVKNTATAPSLGFTSPSNDPVHFDSASQRAYALRYFDALWSALANT